MKKRDPQYWEPRQRKIIVILFDATREFFINDTVQASLWKYFDEHYRERNRLTRKLFASYKERGTLPPVFHVCTVEGTISDTFTRKIEISRYLMDHGYTGIVFATAEAAETLDPTQSDYYQSIKSIPFETLFAPEKNLFPNFKKVRTAQRSPSSRVSADSHRIHLWVKDAEYENYRSLAQKHGLSLSQFFLACARYGGIIKIDTQFLELYEQRLNECQTIFESMFLTFLMSNEVYPADLRKLNEMKNEIERSNTEAKKMILNFYRKLNGLHSSAHIIKDPLE